MTGHGPAYDVIGGGTPTPEEAAAIAAALAVVLAPEPDQRRTSPWRWSGRTWQRPDGGWIRRAP